jgi:two-component system cell cycle sensor histidine kinase/response regulator CckA
MTSLNRFPGTKTILVVEDEGVLREMERTILESCGYSVLEADSGRKAFDLWEAQGRKIDLLLADIMLPCGITGVELAKCLLEGQPQLKIIFTTGRIIPELEHDVMARMKALFLQKPFQHQDLIQVVNNALGGGAAGEQNLSQSVA